jgi:hypothetical protein
MASLLVGPRGDVRVTSDESTLNARSESALAINPLNPRNMVGASKKFINPKTYNFTLAAYATFDGGQSWIEAPPLALLPGWEGVSDPAVAWDNMGNAFLVALPFPPPGGPATLGIAVYKSSDGGRTWSPPNFLHQNIGDDKQGAAGDGDLTSLFYGNVYAAWDDGKLAFARTTDHGATWKGIKIGGMDQPPGSGIPGGDGSFSPALAVAVNGTGTLYIVWLAGEAGSQIMFAKSTDGGDSFSFPGVVASGITNLFNAGLSAPGGFPELPGGTFRVATVPAVCTGKGQIVVVAWADYRDKVSRIYYALSIDGGGSWQAGPNGSGQPLLTGAVASGANQHDFHPQLAPTPGGEIGCAFYEFGPKGCGECPPELIDVILAVSTDGGASFPNRVTVTDKPWDPAVDAPLSHGDPTTTFIGDYFGFTASRRGFFPLWTDTRTGVQEMFTARVTTAPAGLSWTWAGNTVAPPNSAMNLANGWYGPLWVADFDGDGRDELLLYTPGDLSQGGGTWYLGDHSGRRFVWSAVINWLAQDPTTIIFGRIGTGHLVGTGDFDGDGRAEILIYDSASDNWFMGGTEDNGIFTWALAGNTAGFGHAIDDGRPFRFGKFSRSDRLEVLFYFPGDGNWWLGTFDGQ